MSKKKFSRNGKLTLVVHWWRRIMSKLWVWNVANISLHHFPGNKILAKSFDFTVVLVQPRKHLYSQFSTGLTQEISLYDWPSCKTLKNQIILIIIVILMTSIILIYILIFTIFMVLKIVCKSINKMFLVASDILDTGHLAVWSVQHRCLRIYPWETSINTSGCWPALI